MEIIHGGTLTLSIDGSGVESEIQMWNDSLAVFVYDANYLSVYDAVNGSLICKRKTRESIVKAVYCSFMNYGTCIAALLRDSCMIWCEDGTSYSVAFPCRMQGIYPMDNGLLFERTEDALSMNTSFSLFNTVRSFPNYFSLTSPLMLPKPILQINPGMSLDSISNQSILDLSRLLNTSQVDIFASRMEDMGSESDSFLVTYFSQWSVIVVYNRIQKSHTFLKLLPLRESEISLLPEQELLEIGMKDRNLSDSYIQSLSYPDYVLIPLFSLPESESSFDHISLIQEESIAFLYCCDQHHITCYSIPLHFLNPRSDIDEVNLNYIASYHGTFVCEIGSLSSIPSWSFLGRSILIHTNDSLQILYNGSPIQIRAILPNEGIPQNLPYFCHSNYLITYSSKDYQLNHFFVLHSISSPILAYYSLYPHSFSLSFPSSFTPVSIRPILFILDDAWIRNDTNTLNFVLHSISNHQLESIYSSTTTLATQWTQFLLQDWSDNIWNGWKPLPFRLWCLTEGDPEREWIQEYAKVKLLFPASWFVIESFCFSPSTISLHPSSPLLSLLTPLPHLVSSLSSCQSQIPNVSPLVTEAHRLLSFNTPINLHITNENTSVNIPLTIHTYIQSQLLSIQGHSLLSLCTPSMNEHFIQTLHDSVSSLCLSGRKNDESDLLDCEFMGCVLYWPRVHSLVQSLIKSTPNQISLSDINYATEGKNEEDVIGICLTAGYLKLFRMIRFDLMKLKLMYSQLTQWNTQPQHGNTQIDINYRIEAVYLWSISCSYQGTNNPQLLRLLQFYITNCFELFKQVNTRNPSTAVSLLMYSWNHKDRQAILDMLFAAILGVGVTAQTSQDLSLLQFLGQLLNRSVEYLSLNIMRLGILTATSMGLILASNETSISDALTQFLFTQLTTLDHILQSDSSPSHSLLYSPGVKCPVEKIPGILLAQGYLAFTLNHSLDPSQAPLLRSELLKDLSVSSLQSIVCSQRSDILFYYGISIGLTYYHQLTSTLSFILTLVPPRIRNCILSYSLPMRPDEPQAEEEVFHWMILISGIVYVSSIKYSEVSSHNCKEQIQKAIDSVLNSQPLTTDSSLLHYLMAFLYSFLHSSKQSILILFPRILLISFIHSLALLTTSSLNQSCFILFRSLFLFFTKSKLNSPPVTSVDDIIASLATAIGLLTLNEGTASFIITPASLPLLLLDFIPFYPSQLGEETILPELFRQCYRLCPLRHSLITIHRSLGLIHGVGIRLHFEDGQECTVITPAIIKSISGIDQIEVVSNEYEIDDTVESVKTTSIISIRSRLFNQPIHISTEEERVQSLFCQLGLNELLTELWEETLDVTPTQFILEEQIDSCIKDCNEDGLRLTSFILKEFLQKPQGIVASQLDLVLNHFLHSPHSPSLPPKPVIRHLLALNKHLKSSVSCLNHFHKDLVSSE